MGQAGAVKSLTQQMREAVQQFAPMPEPVRDALREYCKAKRDDAAAAIDVLEAVKPNEVTP